MALNITTLWLMTLSIIGKNVQQSVTIKPTVMSEVKLGVIVSSAMLMSVIVLLC
jgi:hypothetical protein